MMTSTTEHDCVDCTMIATEDGHVPAWRSDLIRPGTMRRLSRATGIVYDFCPTHYGRRMTSGLLAPPFLAAEHSERAERGRRRRRMYADLALMLTGLWILLAGAATVWLSAAPRISAGADTATAIGSSTAVLLVGFACAAAASVAARASYTVVALLFAVVSAAAMLLPWLATAYDEAPLTVTLPAAAAATVYSAGAVAGLISWSRLSAETRATRTEETAQS
jgi:hypothetical protein